MFQVLQRKSLREFGSVNERSIQDFIADNPSALGLGDLAYIGRERTQWTGGRLDLLLAAEDGYDRYCVEVQLGATDPSHIIRTIEYWDSESRKNKAYTHTAVIIAETITNRFFNVISILANSVPIIALSASAHEIAGQRYIQFTKVIDTREEYFASPEDETVESPVDRAYWIEKASEKSVIQAERLLSLLEAQDAVQPSYNKHYIGIKVNGVSRNFALFTPRKSHILFEPQLSQSEDVDTLIAEAGADSLSYDQRNGSYRLKLKVEPDEQDDMLALELLRRANDQRFDA